MKMRGQTRKMALFEQCTATAAGFVISLIALPILGRVAGVDVSHGQNLIITAGMTVLSVLRGYGFRRFFNWLHHRRDL